MYTTCAYCETRFRIHSEQLKAAQGLVRCAHCGEVFNAIDHLEEAEPGDADATARIPRVSEAEGIANAAANPSRASSRTAIWAARLLWALGILILVLLAAVQLTWFNRDQLLEHPEGRKLLEGYCRYGGCTLPPPRALEKLKIIDRLVASHPEIPDILRIRLSFENQAAFAQPFPALQVSLFSQEGELEAQRRFAAEEYLDHPAELMQPGQSMNVTLDVKDPGPHVTGFEFAFF